VRGGQIGAGKVIEFGKKRGFGAGFLANLGFPFWAICTNGSRIISVGGRGGKVTGQSSKGPVHVLCFRRRAPAGSPAPRWRTSTTSASRPCHGLSPSIEWSAHSARSIQNGTSGGASHAGLEDAAFKAALRPSTKTGGAKAVPDRRAMESFLAALSGHRGDDVPRSRRRAYFTE
jgi:hypothetical protein